MKRIIYLVITLAVFASCKHDDRKTQQTNTVKYNKISININFQPQKRVVKRGDTLIVNVVAGKDVDSVKLFVNDSLVLTEKTNSIVYTLRTSDFKTLGRKNIRAVAYKDGQYATKVKTVTVLSDFSPKQMTYKIIKIYPHDRNAYTQGLVYEDGILYESTGLETLSSLRKVKLETGEVIQSIVLPSDVFGEGLTIWKDRLIQLTWRSHIGYVYDKKTLQKLGEFGYSTEGWGLTTDGKYLIMSDGTNVLTFLDPETFAPVKTIEVYDDKKPRTLLNELEYIDGKIYANVYTKDFIAVINPNTGAVEAYIDMTGLLKPTDKDRNTDVLNGIAYDRATGRIFVTGKNWPKLFSVKFVSK